MRSERATTYRTAIAVASVALAMVVAARATPTTAQGGRGGAAPPPIVPVAASSLALYPDTYVGETVSMMGAVEQMLSKTAFTVDQDPTKSTGRDVLIIAPYLTGPVSANTYVTVQGVVIRFAPAEITRRARDYVLDLSPDAVARFQSKVAVLATMVLTPDLVDLAKKPLAPLTPEELAFDKIMKGVGPASAALRTALDASSAAPATENVAILKKAFADTEAFFKARGTADAEGWAAEAQKHVAAVEQAVMGGQWEQARTANTSLAGMCQQCHGAHRDRLDDGSYRIRGR